MKLKNLQRQINKIKNLNVLSQGAENSVPLYVYYYKNIPSIKTIHCTLSYNYLFEKLKDKYELISENHYRNNNPVEANFKDDKNEVLISLSSYVGGETTIVKFCYNIHKPPKKDLKYIEKNKTTIEDPSLVYFMVSDVTGLSLEAVAYKKKHIDIKQNYNEDFYDLNPKIIDDLSSDKSGVHIFHGVPGSGKSTYIKYLINNVDKRFIYCPSSITFQLSDPNFIKLMVRQGEGCVLIIEDAEEALVGQGSSRNSAVTNLLNLSDGIIGDALRIQIITTFNTDFKNIDPAILRKGRLLSLYEFKELEIEKAQNLLTSLGSQDTITRPMSLADIYNYNSADYAIHDKKIGL
jgi:SpoVK/Ycf46/Vps4 family AAA+-type ATPase